MELTKETIQNLRQDYRSASLSEADSDASPFKQFEKWFKEAMQAQLFEPNVMTVATADKAGRPSARILLLKGFDERGFVFYTNYDSKKGKDIKENPFASLVFFWADLERQIRIDGRIEKITEEESTQYFHSRPKGSQIGATASPQSTVISDRLILENKVSELEKTYENSEIPKPEHWGGYRVIPDHFEFWQGRPSRLHDRINYVLETGVWKIERLAP